MTLKLKTEKMLLSLLLLLFCWNALSAPPVYAQQARLTLKLQNVRLDEAFDAIRNQSGLEFFYSDDQINTDTRVSINVSNAKLETVLDQILPKDYTYKIDGHHILVSVKKTDVQNTPADRRSQTPPGGTRVTVAGNVKDSQGPLIGAGIHIKSNALVGTVTDLDGNFSMSNVPSDAVLVITSFGYITQEINLTRVSNVRAIDVLLQEDTQTLEEVIVTGSVGQKKVSIVGSITSIDPTELRSPTRSLTTQLAGRVAGVNFVQSSGQPGKDGASFIIRGLNSVTGSTEPLILIDGLKRSLDDVDPNDIESFTVLKDASATAVYGLEGSNGIIVITTKGGKVSEKPAVRVNYSTTVNNTTYKPQWINSVDYAKMINEARVVRGDKPLYSDVEIKKFGDDDLNIYPNDDWYSVMVKPNNLAQKGNFNISGGGNVVTYYLSGGFYKEEGMFNSGNDANANYNQFNFRSNVKADISPTTVLTLGLDGRYGTTTEPGQDVNSLLTVMNNINPTLFPHEYSNGTIPEEPVGVTNPWAMLTRTGFKKVYENHMSTNLSLTQKLDFITEGLFVNGIASFSKVNYYTHQYVKNYQQHAIDYMNSFLGSGYDEDGNLVTINRTPDVDDKMSFQSSTPYGSRLIEVQGSLNYSHSFWGKFHPTALILYKQRSTLNDHPSGSGGTLLINALEAKEQSVSSRVTLDWKHKYFADLNFGLSGSQLFTPKNRWSSFPSFGVGWLISDEPWWAGLKPVVDMFKVRATYGVVGSAGSATRFGYLPTTSGRTGYTFGFGKAAGGGVSIAGIGEDRLEQLGLTWEKNHKFSAGVEIGLFNAFKLITEYYNYRNEGQLISMTTIPATLGLPSIPKANLGITESSGVDFDFTFSKRWGDFVINYLKGVISYNTNVIIENGQADPEVPYQSGIGYDYGRSLNYVALGLFKDQEEIDNSPVQPWGEVLPGDIKYKDIDGDGVITAKDRIWLGNIYPKWNFSISLDMSWKNWTFAIRTIGKANMWRTINGGRIPFNPTYSGVDNGAIYKAALENHWTPASYSGTTATENPNALYPRLAYGQRNQNNSQQSTFWLREASYLRIADIELGYTFLPKKKSFYKSIYLFGRTENPYTFSRFTDWNPEQTSSYAYPLKWTVSLGIEVGFNL